MFDPFLDHGPGVRKVGICQTLPYRGAKREDEQEEDRCSHPWVVSHRSYDDYSRSHFSALMSQVLAVLPLSSLYKNTGNEALAAITGVTSSLRSLTASRPIRPRGDSNMDMSNHLRSLEKRLLNPAVRKDLEHVSTLLADAFVEIGSSGRSFDKAKVLECLRNEIPRGKSLLSSFVAKPLGSTAFLVTYRARREDASGEQRNQSWRCSVWIKRDGR